jgi:hypothetical protein
MASASISTDVPLLSPLSQSRIFIFPSTTTRSPLESELLAFWASFLKPETVYQLVSELTQLLFSGSNRRKLLANLKLTTLKPDSVTTCLGVVAINPLTANSVI